MKLDFDQIKCYGPAELAGQSVRDVMKSRCGFPKAAVRQRLPSKNDSRIGNLTTTAIPWLEPALMTSSLRPSDFAEWSTVDYSSDGFAFADLTHTELTNGRNNRPWTDWPDSVRISLVWFSGGVASGVLCFLLYFLIAKVIVHRWRRKRQARVSLAVIARPPLPALDSRIGE